MSNIDFVLTYFEDSVIMDELAKLEGIETVLLDVDATAELNVDVNDFINIFSFSIDPSNLNSDNIENIIKDNNIKYFVNSDEWDNQERLVINPAHALVTKNSIDIESPDKANLLKHDFIRYISQDIFNSYLGAGLFRNIFDLKEDIVEKGNIINNNIKNKVLLASEADGNGYFTNEDKTSLNLSRELLGQIIYYDPQRLQYIFNNNFTPETKINLPFIEGDSISFKVMVNASPGQEKLLSNKRNNLIPTRSYRIKLNLKNNPVNVDVFDTNKDYNIIPYQKLTNDFEFIIIGDFPHETIKVYDFEYMIGGEYPTDPSYNFEYMIGGEYPTDPSYNFRYMIGGEYPFNNY
jgi:hypothetical protein